MGLLNYYPIGDVADTIHCSRVLNYMSIKIGCRYYYYIGYIPECHSLEGIDYCMSIVLGISLEGCF